MAADPFIGEIIMFAGNYAPRGWAFCNGQLLSISDNNALWTILGTTYGGDGQATFALPDLRGRVPLHWGTGPGLTTRQLGQRSGEETILLTTDNIPPHTHPHGKITRVNEAGDTSDPVGSALANTGRRDLEYKAAATEELGTTGANSSESFPINIMPPFTGVSFIIALQGIFPSQN